MQASCSDDIILLMLEDKLETGRARTMKCLKMKEPFNTWSHFIGFLVGIAGFILLLIKSTGESSKLITMGIYGVSILALYGASSMYHWIRTTTKKEQLLRKLDHIAIFLLIAGTYTPILYYGLDGWWKISMLSAVWSISVLGILLKIFIVRIPRYISTAIYIGLGWMAVIPLTKLVSILPAGAIILIFAGGIAYTLGGIVYATKRLNFSPKRFGFHEIFHIFVLLGTTLHYLMIYFYILPMK